MALAPRIPPRFGSRECFQRLRGWLDECRTKHKHPRCQEIRDTHSDPGRLVYVGHGSGSDPLQLVSTDAGPHPYIALMHCWGTETFIKTTTSNVDAFHQELDEDLLPQSFKDAIKCARAIGVDHVWIDALCIVQDDLSDWQRESAKMRDIYGNAVLLVVADSAPNAAAGFVGARPPEKAGIALEEHDGHDTHEFVVRVPMEHAPGYTASRAWCLQEMVLARRCVIFSSDEMRWECNSLVTCECGANGSPFVVDVDVRRPYADFLAQYHLVESTKETLRDFEEENSTSSRITVCDVMPDIASRSAPVQRPFQGFDSNEDVYNDWRLRVINTFTGMQLTRPTDRLPALSGFASLVGGRLATRYLAGLWLDDLPLGLLWYVHRNDRILSLPDPAPDKYYGPSFSWVSVDGPAKYSYLGRTIDGKSRFKSMIRVHDAKCHVPGQNSYGEVTAGEIRLTGPLRSAILTKTVFHYPKHPTEGTGLSDRLGCEHDLENERDGVPDDPINFIFELDTRVAAARCPSPTAVRSPQEVYEPFSIAVDLLLIGKTWGLPRHSLAIYAALVLGLSPSRPGAYERLGIVQVRFNIDEPDGRQWVERFERREILLV
ncbi:hypothetical protein PRZ48_015279 [Zasmidium cellare]|uniref:Heterokaryon incompatibility domain-containing protein n=1 Tax=Zasmidium cellare TaxID=395010 RepID=A0ABR0DWT1_ZASCE|nr:hypothetical protein PRZ48_015279 [Zasmidium cellare]